MNIQKLMFLLSLILSITTNQFIFSQPPEPELEMPVEASTSSSLRRGFDGHAGQAAEQESKILTLIVTKQSPDKYILKTDKPNEDKASAEEIKKWRTEGQYQEKEIPEDDIIASVEIPYEASYFAYFPWAKIDYLKGKTNKLNFFGFIPGVSFNEETGYLETDYDQIGNTLQNIGYNLTLIFNEYVKIVKNKYNENENNYREKLRSEIEEVIRKKEKIDKNTPLGEKANDQVEKETNSQETSIFDQSEINEIVRNYIKNNGEEVRKNKDDFDNVVKQLRKQISDQTNNDLEKLFQQWIIADSILCKEYTETILPTSYTLSNINEAGKILNFLQKLKQEKELKRKEKEIKLEAKKNLSSEIYSIDNAVNRLLQYFRSPQTILNETLNLKDKNQIDIQNDLLEEEQPIWENSQIQINWREEWKDLDEKWKELQSQKTISSAKLNNHLFARLLICAKAYFNKNNSQVSIDQIQGNDLFKSALSLLSSQEDKYQNIRDRLTPGSSIYLAYTQINDNDFPFVAFFLRRLNGLTSLSELYLENNKLTQLESGTFNGLTSLKRLYLGNNKLTQLESGIFNGLTSLKWLYLENNQLTELSEGVFKDLGKLEYLDLENNQLTTLPAGVFNGLEKLTWLYLHNNQLTTLPEKVFNGLGDLKWLYLEHNQLITLPEKLNITLPSIQKILIGNAGLNNKVIQIPIEKPARDEFKSKLFINWHTQAEEVTDYEFIDPETVAMEVD